MWDHFFLLLFPKDSESLKMLDIRLREVGAKRRLNGTSKSEQTHRLTHRHTHIWKNRLIESIGPEGRCFENEREGPLYYSVSQILNYDSIWRPARVSCTNPSTSTWNSVVSHVDVIRSWTPKSCPVVISLILLGSNTTYLQLTFTDVFQEKKIVVLFLVQFIFIIVTVTNTRRGSP